MLTLPVLRLETYVIQSHFIILEMDEFDSSICQKIHWSLKQTGGNVTITDIQMSCNMSQPSNIERIQSITGNYNWMQEYRK